MKSKSEFKKLILHGCLEALKEKGFHILRSGNATKEINNDFLVWLGLNVGVYDSHIEINPFIGVHCIPIMKLVSEMENEKYQKGRYATYAIHLGNICPDVDAFHFYSDVDILERSERLASIVCEFGIPYVNKFADFEQLLPVLKENVPSFGGYPQRVAACLYLMGKKEESLNFVQERRMAYEAQITLKEHFERFAIPFLNYVSL